MLFYILILFGLYGWIEFEALILIGNEIGGLATFLGIFVTAFVGVGLLRSQGRFVLARWQDNLARGKLEAAPLANGVSVLCGGILMLLPGYVTDGLGLLCFVPGLRTVIGSFLLSRLNINQFTPSFRRGQTTQSPRRGTGDSTAQPLNRRHPHRPGSDIIEGEYHQKD